MAVAVNQPRQRSQAEVDAADPLTTIIKGLSIASSVYGIKEAGEKNDLLKQQLAQQKGQQDFSNQAELAGKGLIQDESGKIVEDKNSSFYAGRMKKGDVDPITRELQLARLEELNRSAAEKKNGKTLPATEALALGSTNAAFQALGDAGKAFDANQDVSGPLRGRLTNLQGAFELGEGGTRAKTFDAQLKANAQIIGKSLEGGKLTDQDIERYKQMLPNLNDSAEAAKGKIAVLQSLLAQKQGAESSALKQAGYNAEGISISKAPANPNLSASTHGISPEEARQELIRRKGIGSMLPNKPGRN